MKLRIILKAYNNELINLATECLRQALISSDCEISGAISLPTRIKRFCVLRSPHVDKDSREHFEMRISKRFIDVVVKTSSAINSLLNLELPSGVSCSIKLIEPISV
jgi:small subunit ribosomal protein S10